MAKKVQLMTNAKQWQVVDGVEVLVDVPQEDLDPITDSSCVEIEGHRTLEETISQDNMFTPEIVETKVHSKVGGVYHDNVVDGAYEEAILYGNTQVNLVESITNGTKYIPHSFTSFQSNESKIGSYNSGRTNQVAPLVKGVTMVNLVQEGSMTLEGGTALIVHNVKGNTEYTLKFTFTQKNSMAGIVIQSYKDENGTLTYLENSKLQSGLGDEVAITFTTHEQANRIHICNGNEYGGETIQLDNIMVIEGDVTDLNLPFFKGMRSVELSRPLTNLFTDGLRTESLLGGTATNSSGTVVATAESIGAWKGMAYFLGNKLKPNTKYLVMWDSLVATQTSTTNTDVIIGAYHYDSDTVTTRLGTINASPLCPTMRSIVFDTGNYDVTQISIRVHATLSNSETGITTIKGLRVFEWDDSLRTLDLQTIGYFSGTKYVSARALETEGKNLYPYGDVSFTSSGSMWYDAKGNNNMYRDIASKSQSRFLLRKGTYTLSIGSTENIEQYGLVDDKEGTYSNTFTLQQDTYMTLRFKRINTDTLTTATNIQIERGDTATTYEAYQSRYYKPRETEEIILKSLPNGVCDTFNLQTGELVQNIGEIVLDGSEDENWSHLEFSGASTVNGIADTYICYGLLLKDKARLTKNMLLYGAERHVIDTLNISSVYGDTCNQANISTEMVCMHQNGRFYLRLRKDRFSSTDLAGWKLWFRQNPITVQYELKEPIITKLQTYARVYSGQTNARTNMGNNLSALTYYSNNYYLKVGNLSPVPTILEPITTIPYDVRLKPSTLYTVKYNRGGYSNSMKFDLGGSVVEKTNATSLGIVPEEFTVKTPAILSHEQIRLSGTGYAHNFIVVEGDITGTELPYFEGMKDVKMPIVKNIGKNLFDGELIVDKGINKETGVYHDSEDWVTTKNLIPITKGKKISVTIDADDEDITSNRRYVYVYKYDMNGNFIANDRHDLGLNTKTYTMNHYGYIKCTIKTHNVKNITITETDAPQPCIDYRVNSVYAVQGEYPITNEMIEQGGFSASLASTYEDTKYDNAARLRSKELIPVKPNTTYAFAHSFSKFAYNVYQWNGNKKFIDGVSRYFASGQIETITTTADTQYIHFLMSKHDASQAITVAEYDWSQFHMYELDSTINLRSLPNGVKDELNLLTGEYIQRVGEVILDGSDDEGWQLYDQGIGGSKYFRIGMPAMKSHDSDYTLCTHAICDKLENVPYYTGIYNISSRPDSVVAFVFSSTLNAQAMFAYQTGNQGDLVQFKQWLQQSPITVQYELAEPIISHVRLVSNNQEREVGVKLPYGVSNTYNPSTGITTVRVGKVVLDGSEEYSLHKTGSQTTVWYTSNPLPNVMNFSVNASVVAEGINAPYPPKSLENQTQEVCYISSTGRFNFTLFNAKASTVNELKTYLASNPITVWYELKYPQIQPDIVLPNGVHDEYNPETGVYTKKVGFVELDGSADEALASTINTYNKENTIVFFAYKHTPLAKKYGDKGKGYPIHTNQFEYSDIDLGQSSGGGLSMDIEGAYMAFDGNPCFAISKEKLEPFGFTNDINIKEQVLPIVSKYLSQNPLKVWYELETPITYQLTPYFGLPQPYAYEDGYLIHDSAYAETTLPPEFKYKLVANRTGQVMQNNRKLQEHTTRLSNLEAIIIEATIESLFNRELQLFELELMDIQLIDLGE